MKPFIILFLPLLLWFKYPNCYAQDVTVSLSVEWIKDNNNELKRNHFHYKVDSIPQLKISYQNNSERDIYMLKALTADNYHPYIGIEFIRGEAIGSKYMESQEPTFGCIFRKESSKKWKIAGIHCLSDTNHNYNEKLEKSFNETMNFKLDDFKNSYMFFPNDLLLSKIRQNINNDFIFLKKGTLLTESYSLMGFFLIGGEFRFYLRSNRFSGRVFARPQSFAPRRLKKAKMTFDGTTILLPDWIDTYQLYVGSCKCDTVFINFDSPPPPTKD